MHGIAAPHPAATYSHSAHFADEVAGSHLGARAFDPLAFGVGQRFSAGTKECAADVQSPLLGAKHSPDHRTYRAAHHARLPFGPPAG